MEIFIHVNRTFFPVLVAPITAVVTHSCFTFFVRPPPPQVHPSPLFVAMIWVGGVMVVSSFRPRLDSLFCLLNPNLCCLSQLAGFVTQVCAHRDEGVPPVHGGASAGGVHRAAHELLRPSQPKPPQGGGGGRQRKGR